MAKPKCPCINKDNQVCDSENLDQGIDGKLYCHDCHNFSEIHACLDIPLK